MKGISWYSKDEIYLNDFGYISTDQTKYINITTNSSPEYCANYRRDVTSEELDKQKLDVMPGFKFSWWYTTEAEVKPDKKYKDLPMTKQFVR